LILGSNNKNVDTQEHKSIRARRDCESERARQSGCRLSVACETQTIYTQFTRQETGERLQERKRKQRQKTNALQRTSTAGYVGLSHKARHQYHRYK